MSPETPLQTDLPFEISEKTFKFKVWMNPKFKFAKDQKAEFFLYQNQNLTFSPATPVSMAMGEAAEITATRTQIANSLVEIIVYARYKDHDGTDHSSIAIDQTVNFGFHGSIKVGLPSQLPDGLSHPMDISLLDDQGKRVSLKAPTRLVLTGTNVEFTRGDYQTRSGQLSVDLQTGANSAEAITVWPARLLAGGTGSVTAQLQPLSSDQYVIASSEHQNFDIPVATWVQFAMAILGGLLNTVYSLLVLLADPNATQKETLRNFLVKVGIGIIGGILAALFANKLSVIGIQLESSVTGYIAVGFLFTYFGIDTFFKKLKTT